MDNPIVTVFIPVYNAEAYIKETLESVINQTYKNLDILLVDDGSSDRSVDIVRSFQDERITLLQNPGNQGIPYTRNVGLREAKGKYLAVMDSDDIAFPDRIEKQVTYMEQHTDIDVLGSFYETFGGKLKREIKEEFHTPEEIQIALLFFTPIANSSSFIRLDTLKKHDIQYNPEYFVSEDYDLWMQVSKVGNLEILPYILMKYRTGHANITAKSKTAKAQRRKEIIDGIHKDLLEYYNFQLKDIELAAFNAFFTDNPEELPSEFLEVMPSLLEKMVQQNQRNRAFDDALFLRTLERIFFRYLCNQKLSLLEKIRLYNTVHFHKKRPWFGKDLSYIVIKHTYRSITS